ncbi:hypothetical protein IFM89_005918 [Coptis chinensis]|uniref:Uncharacterized protein n=1 Tax=Coptis chinensis TaxID=261450 RepID=A0A835HTW4_9MAGN|nr:hypothetical protein IFM89_005918 [Coptis chinensis]
MGKFGAMMEVGSDGVAMMEVGSDGESWCNFKISNPLVNALAPIRGLKDKYLEAMKRSEGGTFSGGFNINVFRTVHKTDSKKPSVAAIQGLALGGGLELALGCHARISIPRVQLGFAEATTGLFPGFRGTQLLPRLIGLSKAVEMMLKAKVSDELVLSSTSKGLVHAFFAQRLTSKIEPESQTQLLLSMLVTEDPRGVSIETDDPRASEITSSISSVHIE